MNWKAECIEFIIHNLYKLAEIEGQTMTSEVCPSCCVERKKKLLSESNRCSRLGKAEIPPSLALDSPSKDLGRLTINGHRGGGSGVGYAS
jgi:hypothetical protein